MDYRLGRHLSLHDAISFYHFRSNLFLSTMAIMFMITRKPSSTRIAADVLDTKPRSGLSAQLKICVGSVVAGSSTPMLSTLGIKAFMPIRRSGAVSPKAWAMPMIVPVRIPGMAKRQDVVQHDLVLGGADAKGRLADRRRHRLQRRARGNDDGGQRHERQHHAADERGGSRQPEKAEEQRKAEQTEHHRRHGGEIVDVHLDEVGQPVLRRELLKIDGGGDADGKAQREADDQHVEGAGDRAGEPGALREAAVGVEEQLPVERRVHEPLWLPGHRRP